MHHYVGVLFTLLAVNTLGVLAAGNIGCLFSETLCEGDSEWCFDDHAFGHCLSQYGHYREDDLHRYDLGSDELRLLEQEMQRLFLLGYRWSHTYTQCVLQELLKAIRQKVDFDISSCNGDVDQDLEGALRAIEGEELVDPRDLAIVRFTPSATDPHSDYADEVYFPPIKDQLLQDKSSDDHQDEDDQTEEGDHQESPSSEPGESKSRTDGGGGGGGDQGSNTSPHHQSGGGVDTLPANPPGPPMNDDANAPTSPHDYRPPPHDPRQQNYINVYGPDDFDDYDDSSSTYRSPYQYQTPLNPVYRKRARPDDEVAFLGGEKISISKLRRIASLLDNLSGPKPSLTEDQERLLFPNGLSPDEFEDQQGVDEGIFGEAPARPMYSEAGIQFIPEVEDDGDLMDAAAREAILSNMPQGQHVVPEGLRSMPDEFRNVPGVLDSLALGNGRNYPNSYRNLPEAMMNLPGGLDVFPGGYNQMAASPQEYRSPEPQAMENSILRYMPESTPFEELDNERIPWEELLLKEEDDVEDLPNSLPRATNKITALQEAFGPQLESIRGFEDDYNDYNGAAGDYGLIDDYGDYGQYDDAPQRLMPPDRAYSFLQKFDKKDEETAGGDYDDMVQPGPWNFQRAERLDTKKPGPPYRVNDFSFREKYPEDLLMEEEERGMIPDTLEGNDFLMSKLLLGRIPMPPIREDDDVVDDREEEMLREISLTDDGEVPDVVLADEGIVDEVTDDVIPVPRAEKYQDKKVEKIEVTEAPSIASPTEAPFKESEGPNSYAYFRIDGRFKTRKEGADMAVAIVRLSGLTNKDIEMLSVDEDKVSFQVRENNGHITPRDVVNKAKELQGQLETATGLKIIKSDVGQYDKETGSVMVFNDSEKHILAAAAIVCGVMSALVVAATVLFFLRRHAKSKAKLLGLTTQDTEASKDYQDLCRARMAGKAGGDTGKGEPPATHAPSQRFTSISKDSDNGNNSPSSRSSTSSWSEEPVASNMDISTGHMVLSYMEDHLKNKDRLEQEWIALCAYEAEPCATTLALKPENSKKNRYPDSVPYDHNRVVLNAHANVNASDYINASSIQTDHDPRNPAYIATQGPLNATAADFWQLVWEQGSVVIVMLTRLTENGLAFCHRYWPEEGSDLYHIYEVHLVSEHIWCDDYLVRSFYLKNVKTGETRTVTQFHFLSWPDSGTPASTKALLEFRRKVNKSYRGRSCPIIVHCSDGIGRTGTYCLIDMVLNRMAKGAKEIDIAATLEHIRDQRPHMVKSKGQFEFVLMAVAEEVHAILKALPQ